MKKTFTKTMHTAWLRMYMGDHFSNFHPATINALERRGLVKVERSVRKSGSVRITSVKVTP